MTSVCGAIVESRRGVLALLWTFVSFLTFVAFVTALLFSIYGTSNENEDDYNGYEEGGSQDQEDRDIEVAVTSRAMAFAALWTAVLASLMSVFGTVVLGFQSPTGEYYTCCDSRVHKTTPLGLGSFIGSLLMLANLTLVCAVLFGEFRIRDYQQGEERNEQGQNNNNSTSAQRSSMAFSIMCMFLTVMYAGFAALTYAFAQPVLNECDADHRDALSPHGNASTNHGYIDGRFDVMPPKKSSNLLASGDFVTNQPPLTMTDTNSTGDSDRMFGGNVGYVVQPNPLFETNNATYSEYGDSPRQYRAPVPPNPFASGPRT